MQVTFTELGTVTQRFPHLRVNKLFTELAVCDITLFCRCVCSVLSFVVMFFDMVVFWFCCHMLCNLVFFKCVLFSV